jgi:hypothetical protein
LSDECDFIAVEAGSQVSFEDPSSGIHRSMVHRVCSLASDLCRLHHPRFYPGPAVCTLVNTDACLLPVPLVGPDCQEIRVSRLVAFLVASSTTRDCLSASFLSQRSMVDAVALPCHSAAFPLDHISFRDRVQESLSEELVSS